MLVKLSIIVTLGVSATVFPALLPALGPVERFSFPDVQQSISQPDDPANGASSWDFIEVGGVFRRHLSGEVSEGDCGEEGEGVCGIVTQEDCRIHNLINDEREKAGVERLPMDSRLHFASQAYAFYMGYTDTYGHVSDNGINPGQRIEMAGYFWRSYGENIASGQRCEECIVNAWVNSPGHYNNIIWSRAMATGVAAVRYPGNRHNPFYVQVFARTSDELAGPYEAYEVDCNAILYPGGAPTAEPTSTPTPDPTHAPTRAPTQNTQAPQAPTSNPTGSPTTSNPTSSPTTSPTTSPTSSPTSDPTSSPTAASTDPTTTSPTQSFTPASSDTDSPTANPTASPTMLTEPPTTLIDEETPPPSSTTPSPSSPTLTPTTNPTTTQTVPPMAATLPPTLTPTTNPTSDPTLSSTLPPTVDEETPPPSSTTPPPSSPTFVTISPTGSQSSLTPSPTPPLPDFSTPTSGTMFIDMWDEDGKGWNGAEVIIHEKTTERRLLEGDEDDSTVTPSISAVAIDSFTLPPNQISLKKVFVLAAGCYDMTVSRGLGSVTGGWRIVQLYPDFNVILKQRKFGETANWMCTGGHALPDRCKAGKSKDCQDQERVRIELEDRGVVSKSPTPSQPIKTETSSDDTTAIIGLSVAGVFIFAITGAALVARKKRREREDEDNNPWITNTPLSPPTKKVIRVMDGFAITPPKNVS